MSCFENLTSDQKIRAALHRDVRAISTETCHLLGLEITKPAIEIVAELVYKKLLVYGTDLEAFAKHAKRATINIEDVKLLVRRCPSLKNHLNSVGPNPAPKEKRRKTVTGKATETPATIQKEPEISVQIAKEPEVSVQIAKEPEVSTSNQQVATSRDDKDKIDTIAHADFMAIDDIVDLTFE